MSDIMEYTLASIPRLISSTLQRGGRGSQGSGPSTGLQVLLRAVHNARSQSDEAVVIKRELARIEEQLKQPNASVRQWSDACPQILFCSVLGYDVSFSYIYIVKLAAQGQGRDKRMGYLAATLLLTSTNPLTLLMLSTLTHDLNSSNILYNLMALTAVAELVNAEHIPFVLPAVQALLRHRQAVVRAKAVFCMHTFFQRAPSLMQLWLQEVKGLLGDSDPGVLQAVVTTVVFLAQHSPRQFVSLGSPLINILQQVRKYKFPPACNYHGVPLPWLQIQLLRSLAQLGPKDDQLALSLLPVLSDILRNTVPKEIMPLALLKEALMTIATLAKAVKTGEEKIVESGDLWAGGVEAQCGGAAGGVVVEEGGEDVMRVRGERTEKREGLAETKRQMRNKLQPLLEDVSKCVSGFLESEVANVRYQGIKVLAQVVSVDAELAVNHQKMVVRCLSDTDHVIRHQTLTLLNHMANPANVKVICSKMLEQVDNGKSSQDVYVIDMVFDLCGRLAPDPVWYLDTLLAILRLPLHPAQVSTITDGMLTFLKAAVRGARWPDFPGYLFTMMVGIVSDGVPHPDHLPVLLFALKLLRFIRLPVGEGFSEDEFLESCDDIVSSTQAKEMKEQVVECVRTLVRRDCLKHSPVSLWAASQLGKPECVANHVCAQKLTELLGFTSLHSHLPLQNSPKRMDMTFSFLDSYSKDTSVPALLRTAPFTSEMSGRESVLQEDIAVTVSESCTSSSQSLTQHSHSDSVMEDSLSSGTWPAVGRVWGMEGVNVTMADDGGNFALCPTASSSVLHTEYTEERPTGAGEEEEEEQLAQALFLGVSVPTPSPPSHPHHHRVPDLLEM